MSSLKHATLALMLLLGTLPAAAASPDKADVVLARDYPNAVVFMQMARRGILDYTARNGSFPPGLQAVQDAGFSAYLFPTNWRPAYAIRGNEAMLDLAGHPVHHAGAEIRSSNVVVVRPPAGLYHDERRDVPDWSRGQRSNKLSTTRIWHFPGAQWLAEGKPQLEVDRAVRFQRLAIHLNWMTFEYNRAFRGMPSDIRDLENYLGTQRNSLGWKGVTEVGSLDSVAWQPGNLFVGWDRGDWVVSMNLGWEVDTQRWVPGAEGFYTSHSSIVY